MSIIFSCDSIYSKFLNPSDRGLKLLSAMDSKRDKSSYFSTPVCQILGTSFPAVQQNLASAYPKTADLLTLDLPPLSVHDGPS